MFLSFFQNPLQLIGYIAYFIFPTILLRKNSRDIF